MRWAEAGEGRYDRWTVPNLRLSPRAFLLLSRITLATIVLNIATGAAVRLSGFGPGLPGLADLFPSSSLRPSHLHPVIEFGNRMVVTLLVVACADHLGGLVPAPAGPAGPALAVGRAHHRGPGRGGARSVRRLLQTQRLRGHDPLHDRHRPARRGGGAVPPGRPRAWPGQPGRQPPDTQADPALLALLVVAVAAGTATTGAGPHAGGKGAKRVTIGLST